MPPSPETRGRPFLDTLPGGPVAETAVTDWLGYLVDGGGHRRAADALAYYRQIEWISPDVESALRDRLAGFDDPRYTRALNVADHRVALVAIQRLVSCANQSTRRADTRREHSRSNPRHQ